MEKIENQLLIKIQIFWRELALPSADKQPAIEKRLNPITTEMKPSYIKKIAFFTISGVIQNLCTKSPKSTFIL